MSAFCNNAICSNRVQIFLLTPDDAGISNPCPQCLDALAATLGVTPEEPPSLVSLHAAVKGRL
jgi:hypothetical protein